MSAPHATCSGRRIPPAHANRYDGDAMPVQYASAAAHNQSANSVNTSISSVNTEPHTTEPTPRRRVPSPPSALFDAKPPAAEPLGTAAVPDTPTAVRPASRTSPTNAVGSPVRKNNPYLYNVLGENASADFAARTSPIPPEPMPPSQGPSSCTNSPPFSGMTMQQMHQHQQMSPHGPPQGRHSSFDWGEGMANQGTPMGSPVLGSYMAQCYSSAFPPGHLPKPMSHQHLGEPGHLPKPRSREGGSGRRRGRRGGSNSPHNASTATVATPATPTTASPPATRSSQQQQQQQQQQQLQQLQQQLLLQQQQNQQDVFAHDGHQPSQQFPPLGGSAPNNGASANPLSGLYDTVGDQAGDPPVPDVQLDEAKTMQTTKGRQAQVDPNTDSRFMTATILQFWRVLMDLSVRRTINNMELVYLSPFHALIGTRAQVRARLLTVERFLRDATPEISNIITRNLGKAPNAHISKRAENAHIEVAHARRIYVTMLMNTLAIGWFPQTITEWEPLAMAAVTLLRAIASLTLTFTAGSKAIIEKFDQDWSNGKFDILDLVGQKPKS